MSVTQKTSEEIFSEGAGVWLLREPHIYDKIGYQSSQALLLGGQQVYKGVGIFIVPFKN